MQFWVKHEDCVPPTRWLITQTRDLLHEHVTYYTNTWLITRTVDLLHEHVTYYKNSWLITRTRDLLQEQLTYYTNTWLITRKGDKLARYFCDLKSRVSVKTQYYILHRNLHDWYRSTAYAFQSIEDLRQLITMIGHQVIVVRPMKKQDWELCEWEQQIQINNLNEKNADNTYKDCIQRRIQGIQILSPIASDVWISLIGT